MLPWPLPTKTACGHWVIVGKWREKRRGVQRTYEKIGRVKDQWAIRSGGGLHKKLPRTSLLDIQQGIIIKQSLCMSARSVMSNSLWPHALYSHQVFFPRNFPGKNTGMGYHFLLQNILQLSTKPLLLLLSRFSRVRLCATPQTAAQPGFPIPGILKARTLEWVAISFSKPLFKSISHVSIWVYQCMEDKGKRLIFMFESVKVKLMTMTLTSLIFQLVKNLPAMQ